MDETSEKKEVGHGHSANTKLNQGKSGADSAISFPITRRDFLARVGGVSVASIAAGVLGVPWLPGLKRAEAKKDEDSKKDEDEDSLVSCEIGPLNPQQRATRAFNVRVNAARLERILPLPDHPCNDDEILFANKIGNYSKGLPHNALGEVNLNAYNALIRAVTTGRPAHFEAILLGGVVRLTDPQAAFAFEMEGPDSHHMGMRAAPAFSSAEEAGEMGEVYWQALTRDVPFLEYDTDTLINQATEDLSGFTDFRGPKVNGEVTTGTLFRGNTPGDVTGPYISQFLLKDIPFGALTVKQQITTAAPNIDYMTSYADWLAIQNGALSGAFTFDPTPRFIRSGRDLCEYVHRDFPYQASLNACLILLGMDAPFDASNPYLTSLTQYGFATFGAPHILDLVAHVANLSLKAAWFQKWSMHRRLRPEEFGGRIHNHLIGATVYPIHNDILNSSALGEVSINYGTYLLPQAYPEGSPTHPAYPSGHASFAGASVTVLKAFFDESFVIPHPMQASADGLSLLPYIGPLTVGGELNKLACNIGIGRDNAGIHYRSDIIEGRNLGEAVAIGVLRDMSATFNEQFAGFSLTKFDGNTITIRQGRVAKSGEREEDD